ncbi:hypothetical protein ACA910_004529 [Epithemia clementina (nom. ined.)]
MVPGQYKPEIKYAYDPTCLNIGCSGMLNFGIAHEAGLTQKELASTVWVSGNCIDETVIGTVWTSTFDIVENQPSWFFLSNFECVKPFNVSSVVLKYQGLQES